MVIIITVDRGVVVEVYHVSVYSIYNQTTCIRYIAEVTRTQTYSDIKTTQVDI